MRTLILSSVAVAAVALASPAHAVLADFTDADAFAPPINGSSSTTTATFGGVTFNITSLTGEVLNSDGLNNADAPCPGGMFDCEIDGIGVGANDDEVSDPSGDRVLVEPIGTTITVTELFYLDLFQDPTDPSMEEAKVTFNGGVEVFTDATQDFAPGRNGYAVESLGDEGGSISGVSSLLFQAMPTNDGQGVADFAIAGFEFEDGGGLEEIPVPAALPLLVTALSAFGFMSYRRRSA